MLAKRNRGNLENRKTYRIDTAMNKIDCIFEERESQNSAVNSTYEIDVCSLYVILCSIQEYLCMIFLKFSLFVFHKNIKKLKSLYMMDEIFELALFLFICLSDSNILCFGCSC